jgi:hypothetical protein
MKKHNLLYMLSTSILLILLSLTTAPNQADAHVVDETQTFRAMSSYESALTIVQSYKGEKSGVTFESYSNAWKLDKLKLLEAELLKNKHGEEMAKLGKIVILPHFAAGDNVLGQYMANYKLEKSKASLLSGRTIYLFGGDKLTKITDMAYTLSHEYGHHFTFAQLIDKENRIPSVWKSSQYATKRGINNHSQVHDDPYGEYIWGTPEIFAEDYVQLFGSETAISQYAQMNVFLTTPFDSPGLQEYYSTYLPNFTPKSALQLYLTDFKNHTSNANMYNLNLHLKNLENATTYIHATEGTGAYSSVLLDKIENETETSIWYDYLNLANDIGWVLDHKENKQVRYNAIQHADTGFNRGSKSLNLNYRNLQESTTTTAELTKDTKNYTIMEIKKMIHEVASANNIPPEVLKAIAYVETGMQQYDAAGNPIITYDGGIGIMQITMSDEQMIAEDIDKERLKNDTRYNIEIGAKILKQKWNNPNLPKINYNDPRKIENWYFAIMAYNGLSKRNDPNLAQDQQPYQEKVLAAIRNNSLITTSAIPKINISYPDPEKPEIMVFQDGQYNWPNFGNETTQLWRSGQTMYTWNDQLSFSRLRNGINGAEVMQLPHYTPIQIIGGPYEVDNKNNHYVMYKVKGNGIEGYIASSNLRSGANIRVFADVKVGESASAITYLQLKNIISGYPEGFKPNESLSRRHAATMLVKALDLKLPEGYVMKATDMKAGELYYNEMAIMEAHGLMGRTGKLNPKGNLTRAQMAQILAEAYKLKYATPTTKAYFTDVEPANWSYDYINTLAFNKITVTANGAFNPNKDVTRSQFSLFLMRTMEMK